MKRSICRAGAAALFAVSAAWAQSWPTHSVRVVPRLRSSRPSRSTPACATEVVSNAALVKAAGIRVP